MSYSHTFILSKYSSKRFFRFYHQNSQADVCLIITFFQELVSKNAFTCIYDWMLNIEADSYKILRRDNVLEIFNGAQYFGIKGKHFC